MCIFCHWHISDLCHFLGMCLLGLIVVSYILCFAFVLWYLLTKFRLNYTYEMHQNSWFIIVVYLVNAYLWTNFLTLHDIFEVLQLTFSCFHDSAHRYTFTWQCVAVIIQFCIYTWVSTDIYKEIIFWEICKVIMEFIWVWYKSAHDMHIAYV